jgi:hypothetical protein
LETQKEKHERRRKKIEKIWIEDCSREREREREGERGGERESERER